MGVTPDELGTETTLTNAFGSNIYIDSEQKFKNGDWDEAFTINIHDLPKEVCVSLATMDWGTSSSSGFNGMVVGNTSTPAPIYADNCDNIGWGDVHCSKDGPMNVATAANACKCHGGNDCPFGITWKFY